MVDFKKSQGSDDSVEVNLSNQIQYYFQDNFDSRLLISILIKLGFVALLPIGLKFHEIHYIQTLNAQKTQLNQELKAKKDEITKIEGEIGSYAGLNERHDEFKNKLDILGQLGKDRLKMIKVLDNIQTGLGEPSSDKNEDSKRIMFFDNIAIQGKNIRIQGVTNNEDIIQEFLTFLERDNLYSSVRLESIRAGSKSLKSFMVTGIIADN